MCTFEMQSILYYKIQRAYFDIGVADIQGLIIFELKVVPGRNSTITNHGTI